MPFQIQALSEKEFSKYFSMSDAELVNHNACRLTVTEFPGTPCRVSMKDVEIGETVLLLNYTHLTAPTPYRASHAVYVNEGATKADIAEGEVPEVLKSRLISVRMFDDQDMMLDALVIEGAKLQEELPKLLLNESVKFIHLHYAGPGCYAAKVVRP